MVDRESAWLWGGKQVRTERAEGHRREVRTGLVVHLHHMLEPVRRVPASARVERDSGRITQCRGLAEIAPQGANDAPVDVELHHAGWVVRAQVQYSLPSPATTTSRCDTLTG